MNDFPENQPRGGGAGRGSKRPSPPTYKRRPISILVFLALVFGIVLLMQNRGRPDKITWFQFQRYVEANQISTARIGDTTITGEFNEAGIAAREQNKPKSYTVDYKPTLVQDNLTKSLDAHNVDYDFTPEHAWLMMVVNVLLPLVLIVAVFYFLVGRNLRGGTGGMLMSFGRSRHRLQDKGRVKITFKDVAGIEEAKDEVAEIIEFLKNPKKFQRLGGRIPRGVLLVGPPGCGKTLLAKAIAGEADVPFFSISGSDFVEMFVGVGASRVRDLFKQAKDNSPCIIFLDEIDAIGRKRGAAFVSGGHDEREQTLNAILVEMDGFDTNDQVIVIAATNRGDILDHALTRPGRFDRQVVVPLPDLKGRMDILKVHARKVKLSPDADLERVARGTPMFSGADLAAIINEAALAATMSNKDYVETADLEEARDKVRWGRAKKSRVVDEQDKKITAFHEAGHAFIQASLKDADPLHKVSIIPRGPYGGATFALPERDRTQYTKRYCKALLEVCYGGRVAEEIFCDDISSGAQADIQQATRIAKEMTLTWGMSDQLGPVSYSSEMGSIEQIYMMPGEKDYSEKTAEAIDGEIRALIDEAYKNARELLVANKNKVERIAQALLKYETLDAADVKLIIEGGKLDKPTVAELLAAEQARKEEADAEGSTKTAGSKKGRKKEPEGLLSD